MKKNKGLIIFLVIVILALIGVIIYMVMNNKPVENNQIENNPAKDTKSNLTRSIKFAYEGKEHELTYTKENKNDNEKYIYYDLVLTLDGNKIGKDLKINEDAEVTVSTFRGTENNDKAASFMLITYRYQSSIHNHIVDSIGNFLYDVTGTASEGLTINGKEYRNGTVEIVKGDTTDTLIRYERDYKTETAKKHKIYVNNGTAYDEITDTYSEGEYTPFGR
nr:hypothetical protein [Bacilli bacterium]